MPLDHHTAPGAPVDPSAETGATTPAATAPAPATAAAPSTTSVQGPKKSKGKLFQCTGYPGCSMIFTRSEHLARHIRKHTGERPFQCDFCFKKFSRLDNLRQHKQTVHQFQMNSSSTSAGSGAGTGSNPPSGANSASGTPISDMHPLSDEQRQIQIHTHQLHHIHPLKNQKYASKSSLKQKGAKIQYAAIPHPMDYHDPNYQNYQNYHMQQQQQQQQDLLQQQQQQNPKTPSTENHINTLNSNSSIPSLVSPPNSVSPHVNPLTNSMLPPPRRNSLLQNRGYSEFRPSSSNKPVPIIIENADSSAPGSSSSSSASSSAKNNTHFGTGKILNHHLNNKLTANGNINPPIITPSTGNGSLMDISPMPIPPLQQYPLQQALQNPLTRHLSQQNPSLSMYPPSSNFSSPAVSPSMVGFADSPSPYVLNFGLASNPQHPQHQPPSSTSSSAQQQPPLPQQPLSPQFYMTNSASVTPTTNQFEFQNNPYISPLYYQRMTHPMQPSIQSQMHLQYPPSQSFQMHQQQQQQLQQQQQQQQQPHYGAMHSMGQTNPIYQAAPTPNSLINTPTTYHMPVPESRKASQLIMAGRIEDAKDAKSIETNKSSLSRISSPSVSKASYDESKSITKLDLPSSGSRDSRDSSPSNSRSQRDKGEASSLSTADSHVSPLGFSSEAKKPCIANLLNG